MGSNHWTRPRAQVSSIGEKNKQTKQKRLEKHGARIVPRGDATSLQRPHGQLAYRANVGGLGLSGMAYLSKSAGRVTPSIATSWGLYLFKMADGGVCHFEDRQDLGVEVE